MPTREDGAAPTAEGAAEDDAEGSAQRPDRWANPIADRWANDIVERIRAGEHCLRGPGGARGMWSAKAADRQRETAMFFRE